MKTKLFLFITIFYLFGFKQSDSKFNINKAVLQQDCISIDEYKKIDSKDTDKQAQWLKKNAENVCEKEDFYNLVFSQHSISKINFESQIKNSKNDKTLQIHWVDLNKIISKYKDYEKYVTFEVDSNGKLQLKLVDDFAKKPSCYSIAFFRSIFYDKTINILDPKIFFEFHQLDDDYVIFSIVEIIGPKETRLSYHNISNVPLMISPNSDMKSINYKFDISKFNKLKLINIPKIKFDTKKNNVPKSKKENSSNNKGK